MGEEAKSVFACARLQAKQAQMIFIFGLCAHFAFEFIFVFGHRWKLRVNSQGSMQSKRCAASGIQPKIVYSSPSRRVRGFNGAMSSLWS